MKKVIYSLMMLVFSSIMFSCSKEEENVLVPTDISPEFIYIYVNDEAGNNIVGEDIGLTLTWRGVTYDVKPSKYAKDVKTRTRLIYVYGLYIEPASKPGESSRIVFGELDGSNSDDDFILNWADGSTNVIHYYAHGQKVKDPYNFQIDKSWKLDGKENKGNKFYFVKKK